MFDIEDDDRVKIVKEVSPVTMIVILKLSGRHRVKYNLRRVETEAEAVERLIAHQFYSRCDNIADTLHMQLFKRGDDEYYMGTMDFRNYYGKKDTDVSNDHSPFLKYGDVSIWLSHYDYNLDTGNRDDKVSVLNDETYETDMYITDTSSCLRYCNGKRKKTFSNDVNEMSWLLTPKKHRLN